MITVVVTCCYSGTKPLIDTIKDNYDKEDIYVIGVNSNSKDLIDGLCDKTYCIPSVVEEESFVQAIINICKQDNVDVVFPTRSLELECFAKNKNRIENETNAKVSVSSLESIQLTNDKIKLYDGSKRYMPRQIVCENIYDTADFLQEINYPYNKICVKLADSCGGVGFAVLDNDKANDITLFNAFGHPKYIDFDTFKKLFYFNDNKIIVQEYKKGKDASICVLADKGKVLYSIGFESNGMLNGSALDARIMSNENAERIARELVKQYKLDGNVDFDFIIDSEDKVWLLEINPRTSATIPFLAMAGMNLPYLRIAQLLGKDLSKYNVEIDKHIKMIKTFGYMYSYE